MMSKVVRSFRSWLLFSGFLLALIAFIPFLFQQILWCRRSNKIFMIIISMICLVVGGLYIAKACSVFGRISLQELVCISFASDLLWLLSGWLTLIFVVSGSHARYEELLNAERADAEIEAVAVAIELEAGRATPISHNSPTVGLPIITNVTLDTLEPNTANRTPPLVLAEVITTMKPSELDPKKEEADRATPISPGCHRLGLPISTNVTLDAFEPSAAKPSPPLVLGETITTNNSKKPTESEPKKKSAGRKTKNPTPIESQTSIKTTTDKPKKCKESDPKKKRVGQKTGKSKGGSLTAEKEIVPVGKAAKADAKALTTVPTAA
jgi:hypothetical protein